MSPSAVPVFDKAGAKTRSTVISGCGVGDPSAGSILTSSNLIPTTFESSQPCKVNKALDLHRSSSNWTARRMMDRNSVQAFSLQSTLTKGDTAFSRPAEIALMCSLTSCGLATLATKWAVLAFQAAYSRTCAGCKDPISKSLGIWYPFSGTSKRSSWIICGCMGLTWFKSWDHDFQTLM